MERGHFFEAKIVLKFLLKRRDKAFSLASLRT